MSRVRKVFLVSALVAGLVAVLPMTQAAASARWLVQPAIAGIDLHAPTQTITDHSAGIPVGTTRDAAGKLHVTKGYLTFDLTPFAGTHLADVELVVAEKSVADCTVPRATQAVLTDTPVAPTWLHQPAEHAALPLIDDSTGPCRPSGARWDATDAVRNALADGRTSLSVVLTMPLSQLVDPRYGRTYYSDRDDLYLDVKYNHVPAVPTGLRMAGTACGADPVFTTGGPNGLTAFLADADNTPLSVRIAAWPVADPAQRVEVDRGVFAPNITALFDGPDGFADDGVTYAWQVRTVDGDDLSAWSEPCVYTVDKTAPTTKPLVTSADYPNNNYPGTGGVGIPGTFVLDAQGDQDVVGFMWGENGDITLNRVLPADHPGGKAELVYTPTTAGYGKNIVVVGVDRAGHETPMVRYDFYVANIAAGVYCGPWSQPIGVTRDCEFGSGTRQGVVDYVYRLDGGPEQVIAAGPDGLAHLPLTFTEPGTHEIIAWSRTADGTRSPQGDTGFEVNDGAPDVYNDVFAPFPIGVGVGVPSTFTFTAHVPQATEFTYWFDDGVEHTVAADAQGSAVLPYTPTEAGHFHIYVRSTSAKGLVSGTTDYDFFVDG